MKVLRERHSMIEGAQTRHADPMRTGLAVLAAAMGASALALATAASGSETSGGASASAEAAQWQAFVEANCASCHSERMEAGGLVLAGVPLSPVGPNAAIWERVVAKVSGGEMPPPTAPRHPDPHDSAAFVAYLTGELDAYAALNPDPGRGVIRRLTRVEYTNAVRDLLDIEMDLVEELPPDLLTFGFANIGEALNVSSLTLERYARVSRLVTRAAVGDPTLPELRYSIAGPDIQREWSLDAPLGTRGGAVLDRYFPKAGEYKVTIYVDRRGTQMVEGQRIFTVNVPLTAGSHRIAAVFPEESQVAEGPIPNLYGSGGRIGGPLNDTGIGTVLPIFDLRVDGKLFKRFEVQPSGDLSEIGGADSGAPTVRMMEVVGPATEMESGQTPARSNIFRCMPDSASEEAACATQILSRLTRKAFRRDVSGDELDAIVSVYQRSRERGTSFEIGIQEALQSLLVSPEFLFRIVEDPEEIAGTTYDLSDFDLASRLSFFLWSSIPDDRLLDLASAGQLSDPDIFEREVNRMLDDPRADALVNDFGMQFLGLSELEALEPDTQIYPAFKETMKDLFVEETRLFLRDIMRSNRSVVDIIDADYTYLNPELADHYGVEGVRGPGFRKVTFGKESVRGGILGQGSVLTATSHPNITSPVLRGKWVLTNLLDQPPAPPPPGVPALEPENEEGRLLTGREQMEMHRTNPVCSSCHARMDPFGFALENFDVTGVWRTSDEAGPIDPAVSLPTGAEFSGVIGLRAYLVSHDQDLARAFTSRMMIYALGRRLGPSDHAVVREIIREAEPENYRFRTLVLEIVKSVPFRQRRKDTTT